MRSSMCTSRQHGNTTPRSPRRCSPEAPSASRCWLVRGGYDDQSLRILASEHRIRPLLKHREFSGLHKAWNGRMDGDLYNQRNMNETVNSSIKKYGSFVRSRVWYRQFREIMIKCVVHNIEKGLSFLAFLGRWVRPICRVPRGYQRISTQPRICIIS